VTLLSENTERAQKWTLESDICIHIFTVSAAMVGVCLTAIGLLRIAISIQKANSFADDILAATSVLFLASCLSAYWALRTRGTRRMRRLERIADLIFIVAMFLTVFACMFVTYSFTARSG
jgi:hypothetical protein